jgi:hypothetical protein
MKAEFKEKSYEKQFGVEIGRLTNIVYSPDQCDEKHLGFDDSFFLNLTLLKNLAPYRRNSRNARLTGMKITELEKLGATLSKRMPPFRFNVFAQYKRPEYLKSHAAKQWSDWSEPYYRYSTTPHQQLVLKDIEDVSKGRAISVYASPAFWRSSDLWKHIENGTAVDASNIAAAGRLVGHGKYTYIAAGHFGKGHSRAENIESDNFKKAIAMGLENEPLPFDLHVRKTAGVVVEAVQSNDLSSRVFQQASEARRNADLEEGSLLWALETIETFADAFDVTPYLIG